MKKVLISVIFLGLIGIFFNPVFLKQQIPFPGDLLVAEFKPWRTYSYGGYVPGSAPNKAQYPDTIRQLYPWKTLVTDSLKKNTLPLWNPYNFSGSPLMANFQSQVLYPLTIFYLLFSSAIAWTILVIAQPFLALFFTYLYGRRIGLSRIASLFSGITYAFSLFMTVWLEYNTVGHVVLWLPLLLLSIEHLKDKISRFWSVIFIFALVSSLFAGHPQLFAYVVAVTLVYAAYRIHVRNTRLYIGSLMLLTLGIGALQLVPGIELIANSARSPHTFSLLFEKILIQPWQLLMAGIPDFFGNPATRNYWLSDTYIGKTLYVGLAPFLFLLSALRLKKNPFVLFFAGVGITTLIATTANPLTYILYKLPIPLISTSAPTLMLFVYAFSFAILAGLGFDGWIAEIHSVKKLTKRGAQVAVLFLLLFLFVFIAPKIIHQDWATNISIAKRPLLLGALIMTALYIPFSIAVIKKKFMKPALILLICVHIFDLFFVFKKFTPFAPVDFLYPEAEVLTFLKEKDGIERFWGHSAARIEPNVNAVNKLYSPEGYDPLYPKWYGEFIQSSTDGRITTEFTDSTRSDASIAVSNGNDDIGKNVTRLRVLDMLGVSYVLDREENASTEIGFPGNRYRLAYEKNAWKVFLNLKAAPRFFLTSDYKMYQDKEDFEKLFFASKFNPASTILLAENPGFLASPQNPNVVTTLQAYTPEDIRIITKADNVNLLFLSDTYYPGWHAFVDGKETKILKANWAFRAVVVQPGEHVIRFVYQPTSVTVGVIISTISATIAGCVIFFLNRKKTL